MTLELSQDLMEIPDENVQILYCEVFHGPEKVLHALAETVVSWRSCRNNMMLLHEHYLFNVLDLCTQDVVV